MPFFAAYTNGKLTTDQLQELRSYVKPCESFFGEGLYVRLVDGEFEFMDEGGPLGRTTNLDTAVTVLAAGLVGARELLGTPLPEIEPDFARVKPYTEPDPPVQVEMDPRAQEVARRLRDNMNERRSGQVGPVDHTKEGANIRSVGEGDGDVRKG